MAWCCGCGVIVPEKETPGWYVLRSLQCRGDIVEWYGKDVKYLCPNCAGAVRAWLGVE